MAADYYCTDCGGFIDKFGLGHKSWCGLDYAGMLELLDTWKEKHELTSGTIDEVDYKSTATWKRFIGE